MLVAPPILLPVVPLICELDSSVYVLTRVDQILITTTAGCKGWQKNATQ